MKLIIDANILFAALISKNFTSNLILNEYLILYAPEFIFHEFKKYEEIIKKKGNLLDKDLDKLIKIYKGRIKLISFEEIEDYFDEAQKISPDKNDSLYFALALKLKCSIWSNDKLLKNQNHIKVYATHELKTLLEI
jgi:predicted nucleic acid-binding protein